MLHKSRTVLLQVCALGFWLVTTVVAQQQARDDGIAELDPAAKWVVEQAMVGEFEREEEEQRRDEADAANAFAFSAVHEEEESSDMEEDFAGFVEGDHRRDLKKSKSRRKRSKIKVKFDFDSSCSDCGGPFGDIIFIIIMVLFLLGACYYGLQELSKFIQKRRNKGIDKQRQENFEAQCEKDADAQEERRRAMKLEMELAVQTAAKIDSERAFFAQGIDTAPGTQQSPAFDQQIDAMKQGNDGALYEQQLGQYNMMQQQQQMPAPGYGQPYQQYPYPMGPQNGMISAPMQQMQMQPDPYTEQVGDNKV